MRDSFFVDNRLPTLRVAANKIAKSIEAFDWTATSAGALADWSDPLKQTMRTMLLSPAPMALLLGAEGRLVHNEVFVEMLGAHYENAVGRTVFDVFPEAEDFYREAIAKGFKGSASRLVDSPLRIQRGGISEVAWFNIDASPIVDDQGTSHGLLVLVRETTEHVRALKRLRRSQERLDLALNAGKIVGTWELDVRTNIVTSDDRFARLFGIDPKAAETGIDGQHFLASIHADDRERLALEMADVIDKGGEFRTRYRVVGADGAYRWVVASGRTVRDEADRPVRIPGVAVDVTNEVAAAAALAESEQRFHTLVETLPQIVWSTDAEGRHDYFNARWREFTGHALENIDAEMWKTLIHPEDHDGVVAAWERSVSTGAPYDIDYRFRHHSGAYRWLRVMALPLRDARGNITRWFGTSTDINESKMLEGERELVALELNHRIKNLFAVIRSLISAAQREHTRVADFADDLHGRMRSLHLAHDFIRADSAASTLRHAGNSLLGLIQRILAPYMISTQDAHIVIEGDDVRIRESAATPLALIFHELTTNAAKHGAIRTDDGRMHVYCKAADSEVRIEWREHTPNRVPPAAPCSGFGSRLLHMIVEGQLQGRMTREVSGRGIDVLLVLPLDSLAEPARAGASD